MLLLKNGDGILGSNSGGVKPSGASLTGGSVFSSALTLMDLLIGLEFENEENEDGFHGTRVRLLDFVVVMVVWVKRPAWVAMVK